MSFLDALADEKIASPTHPLLYQLSGRVPDSIMRGVFGIVRRTIPTSSGFLPPYIAVVFQNQHVVRFSQDDWLSDACIARICLECP